jgi:hypothetical protein
MALDAGGGGVALNWQEVIFSPEAFTRRIGGSKLPKGPEQREAPGHSPNNAAAAGVKLLSKVVMGVLNLGLRRRRRGQSLRQLHRCGQPGPVPL